jgi:hypothetical protein
LPVTFSLLLFVVAPVAVVDDVVAVVEDLVVLFFVAALVGFVSLDFFVLSSAWVC